MIEERRKENASRIDKRGKERAKANRGRRKANCGAQPHKIGQSYKSQCISQCGKRCWTLQRLVKAHVSLMQAAGAAAQVH
jgi:hypothetical protein